MPSYGDLSGGYTPGILFGNDALVARTGGPESSPSGFWDFVTQGASTVGTVAREYFNTVAARDAAQAANQPERTTEYQFIPRDFSGAGASSGGLALSWQVIALVALAGVLWMAHKGT